ncbi:MAG: TonB-dependent receptor plug domain-containing protein [Bacteroidota bacterium]|nr:TonB-dependent receptor plug domain-containing protein [Bacteroidota bacterium]
MVFFIGFESREVDIIETNNVKIQLKSSTIILDEFMVIGYGVQEKVNLSGLIESVKGETLAKRSTIQTSRDLQGIAAGVMISSAYGKPGKEGITIRIRGIGTINDNNPLVLVDGVSSSIDAVDPNDIESMSILKDTASSFIYGSRAANFVILITTNRGKTDNVSVSYKSSVGFITPLVIPKNATAWDYMTLNDEANANELPSCQPKIGMPQEWQMPAFFYNAQFRGTKDCQDAGIWFLRTRSFAQHRKKTSWSEIEVPIIQLIKDGGMIFRIGSNENHQNLVVSKVYKPGKESQITCVFNQGIAEVYINGKLLKIEKGILQDIKDRSTAVWLGDVGIFFLVIADVFIPEKDDLFRAAQKPGEIISFRCNLKDEMVYNRAVTKDEIITISSDDQAFC